MNLRYFLLCIFVPAIILFEVQWFQDIFEWLCEKIWTFFGGGGHFHGAIFYGIITLLVLSLPVYALYGFLIYYFI